MSPESPAKETGRHFGSTQQSPGTVNWAPHPAPGDECWVDSLTWKLMEDSFTMPVMQMVSTQWKGTRWAYCMKRFPFTVTCRETCMWQRGDPSQVGAHLSLWDPCFWKLRPASGFHIYSLQIWASAFRGVPVTGTCLGLGGHPNTISVWL